MRTLQDRLNDIKKGKEKIDTSDLDFGNLLSTENPKSERVYYRDEAVWLDGYDFVRCRFDNCTLLVQSGRFEFDHCIIGHDTKIQYFDPALKIVRLFLNAYAPLAESMKSWGAEYHEDGTLSIRKNY